MIYIYKQCPEESLAGKGQMSQLCCQPCDEGNCCGDSEVRTVFAQLAFWLRDMGQQISGSANYWAYSNTMRGQYYTEINWSGNLQGGEADLCTFAPRTFTGTGAKQKFSFTGCVGCNSTPQEKWCCRGNDMGKFSWQCPCELCDSTPTLPVTFTTGNGWEWDSSGTFGTKGPTYNNQVYWQFPTFQIGPVSTNMCWCTPNYAGWSYFFTQCVTRTLAYWQYNQDSFKFTLNWFWENDAEFPDGKCWKMLGGKECCGDPPGSDASPEERARYNNCFECAEGPHDVWQRGAFTVTINKGSVNSMRCRVDRGH